MMHEDPDIMAKLMRPVGKKVSFQYPGNEGHKHGILQDRAVVASNPGSDGVPYWDVVDLIRFQDEPEPDWIRIGYYRRPKDRLVWGSQTTSHRTGRCLEAHPSRCCPTETMVQGIARRGDG